MALSQEQSSPQEPRRPFSEIPATNAALTHASCTQGILISLGYPTVQKALDILATLAKRWQADYDAVRAVEPILEAHRSNTGLGIIKFADKPYTTAHMAGVWASYELESLVSFALKSPEVYAADKQGWQKSLSGVPFDFWGFAKSHAEVIVKAAKTWKLPGLDHLVAEITLESHALSGKASPKKTRLWQPMRSLGNRNYAVGDDSQVVEENEDSVLQAFFSEAENQARWIALDQATLRRASGFDTAPRILRATKKKYPILAPVIDCPGKKGQGGFKIYATSGKKSRKK
jgi:hypothetical protein